MKTLLLFLTSLTCSPLWALQSSFPGSIPGLSIPNSHIISEHDGTVVVRGMEPRSALQIQELSRLGIQRVLIFKADTRGEVPKEIRALGNAGFKASEIKHIAFPWKDLHDFRTACLMTMDGLKFIEESVQAGQGVFFHCTVGEDRTGYLAGLWALWNQFQDMDTAFAHELCARGYEAGNPQKPYRQVVAKIRETLTPTYLKMAQLLTEARQKGQGLDHSLCDREPRLSVPTKNYRCPVKF